MTKLRIIFGATWVGVLFGLAAGLTCSAAGAGPTSMNHSTGASNPYADFPLWKDVPGRTFAVLGEGSLPKRTRWGVYASRGGTGRKGYENPCISVALITVFGEYGNAYACRPLLPDPERPVSADEPVVYVAIAGSGMEPGGAVIGETVMGLSFSLGVRQVVAKFAEGGQIMRQTKLFNARQRTKTHLPPFRYVALGLQRDFCVETVVGYGAADQAEFEAPTDAC
jgi:hypothetical protein